MISGGNIIGWPTTRWVLQAKNSWCRAATSSGGQHRDESCRHTVCMSGGGSIIGWQTNCWFLQLKKDDTILDVLTALDEHWRPVLSIILTTFDRTAKNNYERWMNCFLYNTSNNTLVWNKINLALPSPSILCLLFFKHRPPNFRECARSPSQPCLVVPHFFIETNEYPIDW